MAESVSVATTLTRREAELIERISKEYGFVNKRSHTIGHQTVHQPA